MIVKTKIMNPTDQKQKYGWIPKHGAFIAAKGELTIDGDVYTLTEKIVKNRQCINTDIDLGRVRIAIITDMEVIRPKDIKKVVKEPAINKKTKKVPVKPKTLSRRKLADISRTKDNSLEKYNILGDGIVEGTIEEGKPPAFDPFTKEETVDERPKAESVSDYLWGVDAEKAVEDKKKIDVEKTAEPVVAQIEPEEDIEPEENTDEEEQEAVAETTEYTEDALKKMLKTRVAEIADQLGCIDIPAKKVDIIAWIMENQ